MKRKLKSLLLAAAVSGLLSGAALAQQNGTTPADKKNHPKVEKNSCAGKSGCGAKADAKSADKSNTENGAKNKNAGSDTKGKQKFPSA